MLKLFVLLTKLFVILSYNTSTNILDNKENLTINTQQGDIHICILFAIP